jgi:5-formyltetrahydrofolate cyclo-ligase
LNSPAARKQELRNALRRRRLAMCPRQRQARAERACRRLLACPRLRSARHVAIYLASGSELSTEPLLRALHARGVVVAVPVIDHRSVAARMRLVTCRPGTPRRVVEHGIEQPRFGARLARRCIDVVVLPLLGVDRNGYRLGQGGGHYDRWLAGLGARPWRVGLSFDCQRMSDSIEAEPWDVRLHAVCSERALHHFRLPPE